MNVQIFSDVAYAALALLVAVLAVYLSLRLLGKLAKFAIIVIVAVAVIWFLFSEESFLQLSDLLRSLPLPNLL